MALSGELFIGGERVQTLRTFQGLEASTGRPLDPPFFEADANAVIRACEFAGSAFNSFQAVETHHRARFLEEIADQIMALGESLLSRAQQETGLPLTRLTGERFRTINQLRLFAEELLLGGWLGVRVDPALPGRQPPRSDLRQYKIPIGPVAVFGASNFPLAFSVGGGDTAAAFAAGCPVIVKGHPAHPGTSELIAQAIAAAAKSCGLPSGVFSLLNGESYELGTTLVRHPCIKAVAFTGSRAGGLALAKIANERLEPIPVYAEMSSINPVVLLPGALAAKSETLAQEFVASLTLGTGQFCTNPGLVLALSGPDLDQFVETAAIALSQVAPSTMLTTRIHANYEMRAQGLLQHESVTVIGRGANTSNLFCGRAALFSVDAASVLQHPALTEEVFGPSSVIVHCASETDLFEVASHLEGQLTATLHFVESDTVLVRSLVRILEGKAGRLIANGWPTGVEVAHAMVHGGPFPATADGRSTSVGTLAIERFLRPVCYQGFPQALLPQALRDDEFAMHPHRLNGKFHSGK